jgi:hypothetical protein
MYVRNVDFCSNGVADDLKTKRTDLLGFYETTITSMRNGRFTQ